MTATARRVTLVLALVGLGFASASTWVHYRLLTEPGYLSPCDVSATFNCSQAYLSSYGSVFGVPVAIGGMAWFALVALIAAFAGSPGKRDAGAAAGYILALSVVGLASILYLGYASFVVLHTGCLLCMGTYACVIGIFLVSVSSGAAVLPGLPARIASDLRAVFRHPALVTVALLYIAGTASAVAWFPKEMTAPSQAPAPAPENEQTRFAQAWARQPRFDLGVPADGAKVVVVKFNDWLCPACKAWSLNYAAILQKYETSQPGGVKYVLKDWPWNSACNPSVPQTFQGHESSCDAAVAVRLAREHGKDQAMEDWLFANQEQLIQQGIAGRGEASKAIRAHALELTGARDFDREYQRLIPLVRQDVADGMQLEVHSTPTYFVNGVMTTSRPTPTDRGGVNLPPAYFDMAIQIELAAPTTGAATPAPGGPGGGTPR
ncbi:MAG: vitamin K epoxide reductase family protein [Vicinamibacterales bacterium]